jgi:endonuclease/exonuclease/phosphatase family metal-dependent hydrolase
MKFWRIIPRWLRVVIIVICLIAASAIFISNDGIQYVLAFATNSFSKPLPSPEEIAQAPNCDGAALCESGWIKVMTYNVLCRICDKDGYDSWDERTPHLQEMIMKYDPDLFGSQELGGNADIAQIQTWFPDYECVTFKFGKWTYADCALFFRKDRFDSLKSGQFWLGSNPNLPFAHSNKAISMPRYVNWVLLRQKSNGFRFLYVNTHFDNSGCNKNPSALFYAKMFRPIAKVLPIIATGDFNTYSEEERYTDIKGGKGDEAFFQDVYDLAQSKELLNNLPPDVKPKDLEEFINPVKTIDHVFLAGPVKMDVARWIQDATVYAPNNRWPSDHPAVYAEVNLKLK